MDARLLDNLRSIIGRQIQNNYWSKHEQIMPHPQLYALTDEYINAMNNVELLEWIDQLLERYP